MRVLRCIPCPGAEALGQAAKRIDGFGARLMTKGGFLLNNELTDFNFAPTDDGKPAANRVEAGKRPRSSMAPTIVFDAFGRLYAVTGSPGGSQIIGYVAKTLVAILEFVPYLGATVMTVVLALAALTTFDTVGHAMLVPASFLAINLVQGNVIAPMLLGHDPLAIELHWRRLYEVIAHIAGKGAEIRGLSAIDVALWDILGQAAGMPVWQLLGGAARDRIKTYNTCGGPAYGRVTRDGTGYGTDRDSGKYEDLIGFMTRADELALDLDAWAAPLEVSDVPVTEAHDARVAPR